LPGGFLQARLQVRRTLFVQWLPRRRDLLLILLQGDVRRAFIFGKSLVLYFEKCFQTYAGEENLVFRVLLFTRLALEPV